MSYAFFLRPPASSRHQLVLSIQPADVTQFGPPEELEERLQALLAANNEKLIQRPLNVQHFPGWSSLGNWVPVQVLAISESCPMFECILESRRIPRRDSWTTSNIGSCFFFLMGSCIWDPPGSVKLDDLPGSAKNVRRMFVAGEAGCSASRSMDFHAL